MTFPRRSLVLTLVVATVGLHADSIDDRAGISAVGPGLGTCTFAGGGTASIGNDNETCEADAANILFLEVGVAAAEVIDISFVTSPSAGTTEHALDLYISNDAPTSCVDGRIGNTWTEMRFELGYGTGDAFVRSGVDGALDFDLPDRDCPPTCDNWFDTLDHEADVIRWTDGGLPPGVLAWFSLRVDIGDVAIDDPLGAGELTLRLAPRACCEMPDSVTIDGPDEMEVDSEATLTAVPSGIDPNGVGPTFRWVVLEGPGFIVGPDDRQTAELYCQPPPPGAAEAAGDAEIRVAIEFADGTCVNSVWTSHSVSCVGWTSHGHILPGDFNADGAIDISDPLALLAFLFHGTQSPPCAPEPHDESNVLVGDFIGDGGLDISDTIYALNWLFIGGPPHAGGAECLPIVGCPERCPAM